MSRSLPMCLMLLMTAGCSQEMANQRRVESQEQADMFDDGAASQAIPAHTVTASATALESASVSQTQANRRWLESAAATDAGGYLSGKSSGVLVDAIPEQLLKRYSYQQLIERGRERFNISCVPCHDQTGSGNGMVARRGFKFPPSYHTDRLRSRPLGYIFNVATNGRGQMPAYGDYLSTDDRWAVTSYVRTLQFARYAPTSQLTSADVKQADQSATESTESSTQPEVDGSR